MLAASVLLIGNTENVANDLGHCIIVLLSSLLLSNFLDENVYYGPGGRSGRRQRERDAQRDQVTSSKIVVSLRILLADGGPLGVVAVLGSSPQDRPLKIPEVHVGVACRLVDQTFVEMLSIQRWIEIVSHC